jgi:hypothetical protein
MSRRAVAVTAIALVLSVLVDAVTGSKNWPGYSALIGLLGCIVIVVVSKWLGGALSRSEDLYPDDIPADVQEDLRG